MRAPRPRAAVAAVALVTALLATGCGPVIAQRNTFESAPLPAISEQGVAAALAAVDAVTNQANAARDPELLGTVEAGPLLTISTALYAYDSQVDPDNATPETPVGHLAPTSFVPRFAGYPQWFVTAAPWRDGEPGRLEVLTRDSSAAGWTVLIAPELLAGVDFPTLALDDEQYVVPLTAAQLAALPTAVDALATLLAQALTTGKAEGLGAGLLADAWTKSRRDADAAAAKTVGAAATVAATYAVGESLPEALRTQDGGALVWYSLTETLVYTVAPNYFLQLDEATAKIVGTAQVTGTLTETSAGQLAVYVPPTASGTARIVAARWDRTGLTAAAAATPPPA